jgi:hypothetical protein
MHFIIYNVACLPKVNWIYNLVVAIVFIAVQVWCLTPVACHLLGVFNSDTKKPQTGIMEKQRVVWLSILNKPMHCA